MSSCYHHEQGKTTPPRNKRRKCTEDGHAKPSKRTKEPDVKETDTGSGKAKRPSKAKREPKVVPEKRLAPHRSRCTQKIAERIARALPDSGHRLFLISRNTLRRPGDPEGAGEEFAVLGATGNVYHVRIEKRLTCSCPDYIKNGGPCKHILFVTMRVLRLAQTDELVWQRAWLSTELDEVFSGQRSTRAAALVPEADVADAQVQEQYRRHSGGADELAGSRKQRPLDGQTECAICFDTLSESDRAGVVFCNQCGNSLHKECFGKWAKAKKQQGADVPCPYCRTPWNISSGRGGGADGDYINLASHSAAHQAVDLSNAALYGARSVWLDVQQGRMSRGDAAAIYRHALGR